MKYLKIYENFKELYDVDPNEEVVIKDEYLRRLDDITKVWGKNRTDKEERIKLFKGRPAKMKYNNDDFFTTLYFNDETFQSVPAYMLINKDKYEMEKSIKKYNL